MDDNFIHVLLSLSFQRPFHQHVKSSSPHCFLGPPRSSLFLCSLLFYFGRFSILPFLNRSNFRRPPSSSTSSPQHPPRKQALPSHAFKLLLYDFAHVLDTASLIPRKSQPIKRERVAAAAVAASFCSSLHYTALRTM